MTQSNVSGGQSFDWLKWSVGLIFDRDRDMGLYFAAALAVLFASIMAVQTGVSADGLQAFVWLIGKVVIAAGVVIFLFTSLRKSRLVRLVANAFVIVAAVYCLTGVVQLLLADRFHPPMARAACLANPFQSGCALSADYNAGAVAASEAVEVAPPEPQIALDIQNTRVGPTGVIVTTFETLEPEAFKPPPGNAVFVHFAGAIPRAEVVSAAKQLVDDGWEVPWSEKGGERLSVAAGLNEIRFFNAADAEAAQELARQFADTVSWVDVGELKVRDLSAAGFNPRSNHQFEVWTSRN